MRGTEGFSGVSLLKQNRSSEVDFLVLMSWASMDAILRFAGEDVGKAVVEPEAAYQIRLNG
jgi:heme-degrading monooxygenase HmoA